jgi:hypothetical protein
MLLPARGPLALAIGLAALAACSPAPPVAQTDTRTAPAAPPPPPPPASLIPSAASPGPETPEPAELPLAGKDFAEDVKLLYRVAACAGDAPIPPELDSAVIEAHCKEVRPKIEAYRKSYIGVVQPYLAALAPAGLPTTVVYPFGGGDLATALTTYPGATEITTMSLELVGDPRRIHGMDRDSLKISLQKLRSQLGELFFFDDFSRSETLKRTQRGDIPGELVFFLVGLAAHGYEPVHLRYFTLLPDGSIHYLTEGEIAAEETTTASHLKPSWAPPDFSIAFANAEIDFVPVGAKPGEKPRVHRHVAANLADDHLAKRPELLHHLVTKGQVCAMTKAASYLLWGNGFSEIREYLLSHMQFMVSDSTGIPPAFATRAGFVQDTYGSFSRSLLGASAQHNADFRKLWASQPVRKLPFRYGYKDSKGSYHLLVTHKPKT